MKLFRLFALVLALALTGPALADFTPPADTTPYLPAQNVVQTPFVTTIFGTYSEYAVVPTPQGTGQYVVVSSRTPLAKVNKLGANTLAWSKFLAGNGIDRSSSTDVLNAQLWWMQNIYPLYQ